MTLAGPVTGVNMVFAHDTEVALAAAAALVNTADRGEELLPDVAALDRVRRRPTAGPGATSAPRPSCGAVRALRPRLRRLWEADEDEVVDDRQRAAARGERAAAARPARRLALPPARDAVRRAAGRPDGRRGGDGDGRRRPGGRAAPAADLRVPRLRQRRGRPVQEPVRSASATPAAATGRPSPPTAPAGPRTGP